METEPDQPDDAVRLAADDVRALVEAWTDRGIGPREAAQLLSSVSLILLAATGHTLQEVQAHVYSYWAKIRVCDSTKES